MNFRNISAWSIRNPVPSIVLFIALTIAGFVSFSRLTITQNPEITFPAVIVTIAQPGAAPTELENQVTRRVEAAVRSLEGVDELRSTVSEGASTTVILFTINTPVDRAVTDVRDAVAQIRGQLPDGIIEPQVSRIQVDNSSIADFSIEATDMTMVELSWYVQNVVSRRLLGIEGMQSVNVNGAVDREIRVILDPARMQAQGVTASQVNGQLRAVNTNAAGGRAEVAGAEQAVRVVGNAASAYALSQSQIALGGGRSVKLGDIATVRDTFAERRSIAKLNGRPVVGFSILRARGASDVTVYDATIKMLAQIEKENPKVHFVKMFNSVKYTKDGYKAAMDAMVEGAILAVVVVFLFLRDWRATAISALAIPLSAIPTFWLMDMMGFNLNQMALLALSLVAGVLVDDAIVEIENIVRHMRMGKTAYQAAIDAADEIGLAVVATTSCIVAVFLPVSVMPGLGGQYFKSFGFTVVVAVLISLGVARLITPMVAAYFLRAHGEAPHGGGWAMDKYIAVLRWTLKRNPGPKLEWDGYAPLFFWRHEGRKWYRLWIRDNRVLTVLFAVAALGMTYLTFYTLPFTFQPTTNVDFSRVSIQMTPGTTLEQTERVADQVTAILKQQQEVQTPVEYINVGNANIAITLKPDRKRSSSEFEREVSQLFAGIADARVTFQSQNGGGGGSSRDISIILAGDDVPKLEAAAATVVAEMAKMPGIRAPRIEGDLVRPEIVIKPRFDLAAELGVTTSALSQAIRIATLGDVDQNVAKFSLSDRQIPIRVALGEDSRKSLSTIQNMPVPTASGGSVPLRVIADISFGAGPSQIQRFNQERRIVLSADLAPHAIVGEQTDLILALPSMRHLPAGVHFAASGQNKYQAEAVVNFKIAVVAGILLVLAVLVLLYRRVVPPFVNLSSLLLAPLGAGLLLHLFGMPISLPVMIGLLMLLGIVAKNSILLIDFAIEEMRAGVPPHEAILDAGHKRAQPILMTTVAMVAGMVPTALSLGSDGAWNQPMGITVIGGLILSTALTLLIVPAAFSLADSVERVVGPLLGRLVTNGGASGVVPGQTVTQPAE